ncbi:MAG: hypothetical protein J5643_07415 [Lachnospiraceae bacterium]|nr:hypothetical protein [Lachnospiraceae bacterium]
MLFERLYETFRHITKTESTDGEGAQDTVWTAGETFSAVAVFDESHERRTGAAAGVSSDYTVTAPKTVTLNYHDIIQRLSDGKLLRITTDGDDVVTPPMATFAFFEVKAEEWELPEGNTIQTAGGNGNA